MTENRRIFCFHDRVRALPDAAEMICLWTQSWQGFGWETMVLGMDHARAHPCFTAFDAHISKFYSRNPGNYDRLCWLRWLAFDEVGGGVMTDYDVINRCLIPQDIEIGPPTIHDRNRVPCFVAAGGGGADAIVDRIRGTAPRGEREHFSDMTFFQESDFPHTETCVEFGHDGWEAAKCVHFSRNSVHQWTLKNPAAKRREDAVRRFIKL